MTTSPRAYSELTAEWCGECNVAVWQRLTAFPQAAPRRKNRSRPSAPTNGLAGPSATKRVSGSWRSNSVASLGAGNRGRRGVVMLGVHGILEFPK